MKCNGVQLGSLNLTVCADMFGQCLYDRIQNAAKLFVFVGSEKWYLGA